MRVSLLVAACLVSASAVFAQSVTATPTAGPVQVTIAGGPGTPLDWVTLTPANAPDTAYIDWMYLNGSKTAPSAGIVNATIQFPAPPNGSYNVRFFADNRLANKLATSPPFTIGGGLPTPTGGTILFHGDSNTAHYYETGPSNWSDLVATGLGYTSVINMAVTGRRSSQVLDDVPAMFAHHAQLCLIMIGTNDMARSVELDTPAETARASYLQNMRGIVTGLKPGCGRLVILSPIFVLQPREVARLDSWVDGLRLICAELGVTFLDVFTHMKDLSATRSAADFDALFRVPGIDAYHLSTAGHAMLAQFVLQSATGG